MANRKQNHLSQESTRGGGAVLTRKLSFPAGAEEDEYQEDYEGRLARRSVVWEDTVIELVSAYIPASAARQGTHRKRYLNKLLQDSPLNRDSRVGGDFNCVLDINKDVCWTR